ncbi:hypothetical protein [Phytohabitans rumicis]|uniref:Uncharacterized protein n=1 Tax=Phytohabitans rumicis TaxID=1076125 RepID=A0A6V8LB55_9ACTN|nr:hypothetical protein [Phytohabitans rumicis]GFJ89925.1 hypothetical protein Prum_035670 [Phytohabitans rumicis]
MRKNFSHAPIAYVERLAYSGFAPPLSAVIVDQSTTSRFWTVPNNGMLPSGCTALIAIVQLCLSPSTRRGRVLLNWLLGCSG